MYYKANYQTQTETKNSFGCICMGKKTEQNISKDTTSLFYVVKVQIEAKAFSEMCKLLCGGQCDWTQD